MFFNTPVKDSTSFEAAPISSGAPRTSPMSWMRACADCSTTPKVPSAPEVIERGSILHGTERASCICRCKMEANVGREVRARYRRVRHRPGLLKRHTRYCVGRHGGQERACRGERRKYHIDAGHCSVVGSQRRDLTFGKIRMKME